MNKLDYIKRLGLQGSRLGWRVFMILLPVVGYSLIEAMKGIFEASSSQDANSSNQVIGSRLEAWEAFDQGKIDAAEMAYYEEVYGD